MQTLLLTGIIFVIVVGSFYMISLYYQINDEHQSITEAMFMKDLERTKNAIKFCRHLQDSDNLIDKFEERWKGLVELSYLHNAIGKLIETQFSNEINYQP